MIYDLIDIRFSQFRAFKAVLKHGCLHGGFGYRDIIHEGIGIFNEANSNDILLVPPYGKFINFMRNKQISNIKPSILMIDLKGPMGIDSFLQIYNSFDIKNIFYCSTMLCDYEYHDYFEIFGRLGISCFPLPFFPNPIHIEKGNILNRFNNDYPSESTLELSINIFFAGSVWGHRERYLNSLKEQKISIYVDNNLSHDKYMRSMSDAAIAIDMRGNQAQTYRLYEIFLAKSCCLAEHRPIFFLNRPPRDLEEIVWFDGISDLINRAKMLLEDIELIDSIRKRGALWFRETQNPVELIKYLIKIGSHQLKPLDAIERDNHYYFDLKNYQG